MALDDILVTMGGANPLAAFGGEAPSAPGFAGGMFDTGPKLEPMDFSAGINKALDDNRKLAMQRQRKGNGTLFGGGIGNFLGMLGDAFLNASGGKMIYTPRREQERLSQALSNYLGNVDPGLAEIMARSPEAGLAIYKMKHGQADLPETIELMRAAGIDPASDEGKALIRRKLEGGGTNGPNFIRELEALGIDPRSQEARELYYGRNSPAGYLLKPGGGSESLPRVNSQDDYDALPAGTRYRDSQGNVGVKGGATGGNSSLPFDQVMGALIKQESGGDGTAIGPKTEYGRALGSTQMLPGTAKEMAAKLGLPFRPDMLKSNAPAALKYQRALGEAYLKEGLAKTGNLKDALRYYHGGPDRSLWGPKTDAHAASVLAILGAQ